MGAELMSNFTEWLMAVAAVQLIVALYMFFSMRAASRERAALSKEMFGLMKKIEGLTARRREQALVQFDRVLDALSVRLPTAIASKVSDLVFETERQILSRLAEIEPSLKDNAGDREKMEELICSMEKLEETVVAITSDSVQQVMMDSRRSLFQEDAPMFGASRLLTQ